MKISNNTPENHNVIKKKWTPEKIAQIGSIISAIFASACCWLPLLLLTFGVSGVAVSASLEKYRSLFITITAILLAVAFYFTYRPRQSKEDCCAATDKKTLSIQKFNKIMLWIVTAIVLAFVFFPNYIGVFLQQPDTVTNNSNLKQTIIHIEGMTCEACATTLTKAIAAVPGVATINVNFAKKEATVGVAINKPIPHDKIMDAIIKHGYKGKFSDKGVQNEK